MQLAEPARLGLGRLARMQELVRAAAPRAARARAPRRASRPRPSTSAIAPGDDPRDAPALVGQLLAGREVDARDLEERDVLCAGVDAGARRLDQARHERRPQDRLLGGHRARKPDRVRDPDRSREAPRVRLRETGADEHVLDDPAQPLLLGEPAAHVPAQRHRERDAVEQRPRDLLDHVDLARDVARAPGRDGHVPLRRDVEAERFEGRALVVRRDVDADELRCALRPQTDDGPLGKTLRGRRRGPSSARRRGRRAAGSRARRRSRRGTGRRPSPSGSSLPCGARASRRCEGCRAARSSRPRGAPRSSRR